jgi:hypothetical protein
MAPKLCNDPFARVPAAAAHLPEVEESTWFGTPSLKVRSKSFVRLKAPRRLVVAFDRQRPAPPQRFRRKRAS